MNWALGGLLAASLVADPREVVVVPQFDDAIPVPVQRALRKTAEETVSMHGVSTRIEEDQCEGVGCADTLAGQPGLTVTITREARDYTVTAQALAPDGSVEQEATRVCNICRHDELGSTVTEAVAAVAGAFDEVPTGRLSVVSRPSGASVWVDGEDVGETPLELELPAGTHELQIRADGRDELTRSIEIVDGEVTREAFKLSRSKGVSPRTEELLGWGGVGLGAAAVATGIALLVIDEREIKSQCSQQDTDTDGDCRFLYDTVGAGAGMFLGGVVVAGAGGALVWHGRKRRMSKPSASASIGPGGVWGRF